jgi:hypothetical protein
MNKDGSHLYGSGYGKQKKLGVIFEKKSKREVKFCSYFKNHLFVSEWALLILPFPIEWMNEI